MAGYSIYIPRGPSPLAAALASVGLEQLLAEGDPQPDASEVLDNGPDGGAGVLFAWRHGDPRTDPPMNVDGQTWTPAKPNPERDLAADRFWIGTDPDRPVTPDDIARPHPMAGTFRPLADGQVWRIPQARFLPHPHGLDDEGRFARRVDPRYEKFWTDSEIHAAKFFEAFDAADALRELKPDLTPEQLEVTITIEETWQYCIDALAMNYRLNADLVDHLGLLDDATMQDIVMVTINLPALSDIRAQKKTELPVIIPNG